MMEHTHGLSGSRWAPHNHTTPSTPNYRTHFTRSTRSYNTSPTRQTPYGIASDGDWDCPGCGFENFGWRRECMRCQKSKEIGGVVGGPVNGKENVAPSVRADYDVNVPAKREFGEDVASSGTSTPKGALAMSRWAPRNRVASQKYGDKTWTKMTPSLPTSTSSTTQPSQPDLGLPYEVQHYILHLLQTTLEEACFALASRWLPAQLALKKWSCSEAVELSVWRDFLPSNLPSTALHQSDVTLEQGLQDAVRIRNKAVHRHLVDNNELKGLCWRGERLIVMFEDGSRQEKCARLREELERWDRENKGDEDAKRRVLEAALVVIGERPVADMDWTPNEVSMAEIMGDDVRGGAEEGGMYGSGHNSGVEDVMDLD